MATDVPIYDFSMIAGDSKTLAIIVYDCDGNIQPITGASIKFSMMKTNMPNIRFDKEIGNGLSIIDGGGGLFHVLFGVGEVTIVGAYRHQSQVILSGDSQTTLKGMVFARPSLTPNE
ncbi:MAG: hypothetical protein OEQ29_08950 [Alphaproteobacteria bacterium]|nr:hypothetical protein [Alphaproteobacteria bacterium]